MLSLVWLGIVSRETIFVENGIFYWQGWRISGKKSEIMIVAATKYAWRRLADGSREGILWQKSNM